MNSSLLSSVIDNFNDAIIWIRLTPNLYNKTVSGLPNTHYKGGPQGAHPSMYIRRQFVYRIRKFSN